MSERKELIKNFQEEISKNKILNLFVGKFLKEGKRAKAERILIDCLLELKKRGEKKPLTVFLEGIEAMVPLVEIKSKKVGGTVYRIPIEVTEKRGLSLAISWLLKSVKSAERGRMEDRIINEILLARQGQGKTMERVRELHSFAEKNRGLVKFL